MAIKTCIIITALIATALANVVTKYSCEDVNADICRVSEVRVDPCKNKKRCDLPKGVNASIEFDFLPNFSASKLKSLVYWDQTPPIPFDALDENSACELTKCPTEAGISQVYNFNLHIGKMLPASSYKLKWMVWNADNIQEMCCFKMNIKITNKKKKTGGSS